MTQSVTNDPRSLAGEELLGWFVDNLRTAIDRRGYRMIQENEQTDEGGIVLYPVAPSGPKSFRRRNRAVFVVGIDEAETYPEVPLKTGYPMLLRTLSNLFIMICQNGQAGQPGGLLLHARARLLRDSVPGRPGGLLRANRRPPRPARDLATDHRERLRA